MVPEDPQNALIATLEQELAGMSEEDHGRTKHLLGGLLATMANLERRLREIEEKHASGENDGND